MVYTDESAVPNPGRIGLRVSLAFNNRTRVLSERIGIGSILTAELCAIQAALKHIQLLVNNAEIPMCQRTLIFTDCQIAIELIHEKAPPSGDYEVLNSIRNRIPVLKPQLSVDLVRVPAHVGVRGNESANSAAKEAAYSVNASSPTPGQPPITLGTSVAFIRQALNERRQQRWLAVVAAKQGSQHLSRIKANLCLTPAFFVSNKADQSILAKLRLGHCELNASRSRIPQGVDETCACGVEAETVEHYLLRCSLCDDQRATMLSAVRETRQLHITEDVLLGGSSVRLDNQLGKK